jgi:hypothetical protein
MKTYFMNARIYIYICVCVCVCVIFLQKLLWLNNTLLHMQIECFLVELRCQLTSSVV